jgi:hypothetical protein
MASRWRQTSEAAPSPHHALQSVTEGPPHLAPCVHRRVAAWGGGVKGCGPGEDPRQCTHHMPMQVPDSSGRGPYPRAYSTKPVGAVQRAPLRCQTQPRLHYNDRPLLQRGSMFPRLSSSDDWA